MKNHQIGRRDSDYTPTETQITLNKSVLICSKVQKTEVISVELERCNFVVHYTNELLKLNRHLLNSSASILIIDASFIYSDILSFMKVISSISDRPGILVRSSTNHEVDRILALELGADDCVDASCSTREIGARAVALARRMKPNVVTAHDDKPVPDIRTLNKWQLGGWELQVHTRRLSTPSKNTVHLTSNEYLVLSCLMNDPGSVKSRSDLQSYCEEEYGNDGELRSMDVLVSRIRKKMTCFGDENAIETVRGLGYRFLLHNSK
ncbi:response regulator transcription factor [Sphingomonas sp. PB2P19]|uniref:response regulator transcription factor n=1 Tax=Sphingomonas rhamnosi TaxID=3096156 RepID=UPI002FC6AD69